MTNTKYIKDLIEYAKSLKMYRIIQSKPIEDCKEDNINVYVIKIESKYLDSDINGPVMSLCINDSFKMAWKYDKNFKWGFQPCDFSARSLNSYKKYLSNFPLKYKLFKNGFKKKEINKMFGGKK